MPKACRKDPVLAPEPSVCWERHSPTGEAGFPWFEGAETIHASQEPQPDRGDVDLTQMGSYSDGGGSSAHDPPGGSPRSPRTHHPLMVGPLVQYLIHSQSFLSAAESLDEPLPALLQARTAAGRLSTRCSSHLLPAQSRDPGPLPHSHFESEQFPAWATLPHSHPLPLHLSSPPNIPGRLDSESRNSSVRSAWQQSLKISNKISEHYRVLTTCQAWEMCWGGNGQ